MRRIGLAWVFVLGVSCGGGGSTTVTLAELPARLAAAQCGRVFRCCSTAQVQALYGTDVTSESVCRDELALVAQLLVSGIEQSQAAGRVRYDGAAAGACFQAMASAACTATSNVFTSIPPCDAFIVPLVANGGACAGDEECTSDFCDRPLASGGDGMCAQVPTKGMPCTSRCVAGATCDTVAGMCVDPKADGSFCFVDEDCVSGNCDNPNITGGTCIAAGGPTCGPTG
jgi:hypothetical protein